MSSCKAFELGFASEIISALLFGFLTSMITPTGVLEVLPEYITRSSRPLVLISYWSLYQVSLRKSDIRFLWCSSLSSGFILSRSTDRFFLNNTISKRLIFSLRYALLSDCFGDCISNFIIYKNKAIILRTIKSKKDYWIYNKL